MKQYSIHPILNFIKNNPRPHYRAGDLQQMADKVANQRRQKLNTPGQENTTAQEDEYLEIIAALQARFHGHKKISRAALHAAVNKILAARRLKYTRRRATVRHSNTFFASAAAHAEFVNTEARAAGKYSTADYDLAFYHPASPPNQQAHHKHGAQSAVFFMRVEEFGPAADKVLVGNLQVDETRPEDWAPAAQGRIFLKPKNLDLMLAQEAIKYALAAGKKEILFQDGDAMDLAQYREPVFEEIMITPANVAQYTAEDLRQRQKFTQMAVGDNIGEPGQHKRIVYEKTPAAMKIVNYTLNNLNSLAAYLREARDLPGRTDHEELLTRLHKVRQAWQAPDLLATRAALDDFWDQVAQTRLPRTAQAAKLHYLQDRPPLEAAGRDFENYFEAYAREFKYDAVFRQAFPHGAGHRRPPADRARAFLC